MAGVAAATVAVGAISAGVGAVTASKNRKSQEKAQKRAELNEKNRRQAAAEELEKATKQYNELRKQRPGLTVQEYLQERADQLTGPEAKRVTEALRATKQEDFERAQAVADAASTGNVKTFDVILDAVSGGDSAQILADRNKNALGTNELDAFNRALELRSTAIPAGTVRQDSQGRFVEGQRADKQAFQLAFETGEAVRDKQFSKLNTILDQDRQIALRQQDKALDFLSQQETSNILNSLTQAGSSRLDAFQLQDENVQLQQIRDFQNSAFNDQTKQVAPVDNSAASALISGGFDLAMRGLGTLDKGK